MEENPVQNTTQVPNPIVVENSTIPSQSTQALNGQLPNSSVPSVPESHENNIVGTLIAIFLLLFIYPIGLIFMWFATKWPKRVKLLLTLLPVILIIVGIVVVFTTALIGSRNISKSSGTSPSIYEVSPKPTIPVIIEGNRIINNDGGYSFILPSPWKAKISSFTKTDTIFGTAFLNDLGTGDIRVSSGDKSLSDALSKQNPNNVSQQKQITIDGVPGVIEDLSAKDSNINIQGKVAIVYKNGRTYTIEVLSNDPGDVAKFQEILSTFKFTQ